MNLSIIIPAYNEAEKIGSDIAAAAAFLERNNLTGEIIIVDDGSRDDTAAVAQSVKTSPVITTRVVSYTPHRGKGHAIRSGMEIAGGEFVMFADSGCCVPYEYALTGLNLLKGDQCDIAHGSRKLPESIIRKPWVWYRKVYSSIFRWVLLIMVNVPHELSDTQCGFKIYRGKVAQKLFGECISDGFMFDVEIILRARQQGYKISEFPIEWTADRDSRLSLLRNIVPMILELLAIKRVLRKEQPSPQSS
jgi:dolichyl-phosphate beta-glucosyltransferase